MIQSPQGRLIPATMAHSRICCLIHVVFSTSERRATIRPDREDRLYAYLGGIAHTNRMHALAIGGTLLSRNLRDFRRVPGLVVEDWTR